MSTTTYRVTGMTCEHCAGAVRTELSALDGVAGVRVDLAPGGLSTVEIDSADEAAAPTTEAISAALAEAGDYWLAP